MEAIGQSFFYNTVTHTDTGKIIIMIMLMMIKKKGRGQKTKTSLASYWGIYRNSLQIEEGFPAEAVAVIMPISSMQGATHSVNSV